MDYLAMPLAFADAAVPGGALLQFLPLLLVFGIFYFLLIMPMRKRQKAHAKLLTELKKGDRVITNGGIYGEVSALEEKTVILRVADSVRIKVARSAIAGLEGEEAKTS
ncbi:MAG: preprotein translocase subunit YajC [Thermoanaerobaculia bacterium]